MKNLILQLIIVCAFLLTGCASTLPTLKSDTLKSVEIEPTISALPLVADLAVSEKKARGEAKGYSGNIYGLQKEAITNALGQNPPSVDKPDALIGTTFFYEYQDNSLKVIATGYPAYYVNFRSATEDDSAFLKIYSPSENNAFYRSVSSNNSTLYFSAKYQATAPFSGAGGNIETGYFQKGYFGFDCGGGRNDFGGGFSWGGRIKPTDWFLIIPGCSAGWWAFFEDVYREEGYHNGTYYSHSGYYRSDILDNLAFGGPFVKLLFGKNKTWGEFSYRLLFGMRTANQIMFGFTYIK